MRSRVVTVFQAMTHGEWGVGIDAVGALEVWPFHMPGFDGLNLEPGPAPHMGVTASGYSEGGSDTFHFPDGNASIARLLVRSLVPGALTGHTAQDIVTAKADYTKLDRPGAPIRIRLCSLAVKVTNIGEKTPKPSVEVVYSRGDQLHSASAGLCVMASWNMMIPYLCPEMPDPQKAALHYLVKTPLVYTTVAIRNWRAFKALGISNVYAPGSYHTGFGLNPTVDIGDYKSPRSPDEPILIRMFQTPCKPNAGSERDQNRIGGNSFWTPVSRRSSAISAISFSARWAPAASTPRRTSPASPSIAGRTAMPMSSTRCSTPTGPSANSPTSSAAPRSGASPSPTPIPAPPLIPTARSIRPTARWARHSRSRGRAVDS